MKKIVDINFLQRPELNDYFLQSKDNFVVFTDFACMEIYKSNAPKNLFCKFEIVSRYPKQVTVLKGTREIVSITLTSKNLPQDLIDDEQTKGFQFFCDSIRSSRNKRLSPPIEAELLWKQSIASQELEKLKKYDQLVIDGIRESAKSFDPSFLKSLRTGKKFSDNDITRIIKDIVHLSALCFKMHPDIHFLPESEALKDSYIFRYTVSSYLLGLTWLMSGGLDNISIDKFRNDMVDMSYVTYSTYFDGILSCDKKANELYRETSQFLQYLIKRVFTKG
jgi:hypothetical protein